ncbi:alpha/beta hydrolase family protein [Maricaulis parjimensis]|uniref:alpha/beta hydrolase family protein n=1 Tax=Maricaulis parjimensis TaxID=144023 RepID=UPI001939E443|nr:alpha/beta fold hydrolase [Maricaulis parjimensis]
MLAVLRLAAVWAAVFMAIVPIGVFRAEAQRIPSMGEGAIEDYLRHVTLLPRFLNARLSPSGRFLLLIEQAQFESEEDTVLIFDFEAPEGQPMGRRISVGTNRVQWVEWANEDRFLIAIAPRNARSSWRLVGHRGRFEYTIPQSRVLTIDRETLQRVAVLFDNEEGELGDHVTTMRSNVTDFMPDDPDHILMPSTVRDRYSLYRVNIETGHAELVERGNDRTVAWFSAHGEAVIRVDESARGEHLRFHARTGRNGSWRRINTVRTLQLFGGQPDFEWAGPSPTPGEILVRARPDGAEYFGIYRYDLANDRFLGVVDVRDDYDIETALIHGGTGEYAGYAYHDTQLRYEFADPVFSARYASVVEAFGEDRVVQPVSISEARLVVLVSGPTEPGTYYMYDAATGLIDELVAVNEQLAGDALRPMETVSYTASDGVEITGYLTSPRTGSHATTPLVVMPHGGPEVRDTRQFDPVVQYLAAHGYTVFQPNYRGSSGFGRTFAEAGYRQWGRRMQDDVSDGVRWLIETGRADPEQICIVGFSYGGYAALAGATLTPELYRCAIAGGAVTDLDAFLEWKDEFSREVSDYWVGQLGERRADRDFIRQTSPVHLADQAAIPIYLFHGIEDGVVPVDQSRAMAEALEAAGADYVYEEVAELGHSWGYSRQFVLTMRNLAAFLDDAMDGQIDTFNPHAGKPATDED